MKNVKKFMLKLMVLSLAFVCVFAIGCGGGTGGEGAKHNDFIDTIGGVSETYKGEICEQEFETKEDAAEAYVMQQVVGNQDAQVVNTTSMGTLSASQVNSLIPTEMKEGIVSVEKIEVEYSVTNDATPYAVGANGVAVYDTLNTTKKVEVYVIVYADYYTYFTPAPVTGDTITKAYYDSVFNTEKYENCTFKSTSTVSAVSGGSYNGTTVNYSMDQTVEELMKITEDKIYLELKVTMSETYVGVPGEENTEPTVMELYAYIENVNGDIKIYIKEGADSTEWVEGNLHQIGFSDFDDLMPFADAYLDYTYFTKTDFGFEVADENAELFVSEILEQIEVGPSMDIDMIAKFYVSNGVLSGMREDVNVSYTIPEAGVTATATVVANMTCTDYGTTVVERPFEVPTTVTASGWVDAFDIAENPFSYTVNIPGTELEYKYDGEILFSKQTDEDGVLVEYLFEEDGVYYEYEKYNDGEWTLHEIDYEDYYEEIYGAIGSFASFNYSDFTYNTTTKKYEANNINMEGMPLSNVKIAFEMGAIKTVEYTIQFPNQEPRACSIVFDYSEVILNLPVVD